MNKGIMLQEMLIVLIIIAFFSSLTLKQVKMESLSPYQPDSFMESQVLAMYKRKKVTASLVDSIHYNEYGNINQGATLVLNNHTLVFNLGFGRYHEK